jgi:hypothetical protein
MAEQLPMTTHENPTQPTIAEAIKRISGFIDPKVAEKILREYQEGQAIVAEDSRLELDTAECIQHQQLVAEQIQKNERRRQELVPQLTAALQRETELRIFIEGFAKFISDEPITEDEVALQEVQPSLVRPLSLAPAPKQPTERRPLSDFRNTTARRPLGAAALVQGTLKTAVRGTHSE